MKKIFLFLLFHGTTIQTFCAQKHLVAKAVLQVIQNYYGRRSESFDIIFYHSSYQKVGGIVDMMMKIKSENIMPYKITIHKRNKIILVPESAILLFENMDEYEHFHSRAVFMNELSKICHILVYIQNFIEQGFKTSPNGIFPLETFLIHKSDQSLGLMTYLYFQQPKCRQWVEKEINIFTEFSLKWKHNEYFIEKFNNFNGCEMVIMVPYPSEPDTAAEYDPKTNQNVQYWGNGIKFANVISKYLNYTYTYNGYDMLEQTYDNASLIHDFYIHSFATRILKVNTTSATIQFRTSVDFILIPHAEYYTPFEKLFLPFEAEVWFWLVVTITTAVTEILIVKLFPIIVEKFVFGSEVKTPLFNLIAVVFGSSLRTLPGRNFARFLLMSFVLFCLVMRTAYQGKQFEFIQKDMQKGNIRTIEQMIEQNYSIMFSRLQTRKEQIEIFKNNRKVEIPGNQIFNRTFVQEILSDGTNRGVIVSMENWNIITDFGKRRQLFHILPETLITNSIVFYFHKNNFMFKPFSRKVTQLMESGLGQKYVKEIQNDRSFPADESSPKVLTLDHLSIGFKAWLAFLLLSFFIFLIELFLNAINC